MYVSPLHLCRRGGAFNSLFGAAISAISPVSGALYVCSRSPNLVATALDVGVFLCGLSLSISLCSLMGGPRLVVSRDLVLPSVVSCVASERRSCGLFSGLALVQQSVSSRFNVVIGLFVLFLVGCRLQEPPGAACSRIRRTIGPSPVVSS